MFWGSLSGSLKGPGIFWEKDWGSIKATSYQERTIPIIHGWLRLNPTLILMQDGAPGHSAAETIQELHERGFYPIFWPAFSPDLNPIETVWNRMKDYIIRKYPDYRTSYDKLRTAVKEAWDAIGADELQALVREMPARCQAVIDADGRHTKY
jgi:transposase